jgi:hypothetical protein
MPRPSLAVPLVPLVPLAALACAAACTKLAELAGAPDRSAASISVHIAKDSLTVGDTLQIGADVNSKDGRPAWTDTTVTWQSSNPAVVAIDASNPPPGPHNFARLIAKSPGQSTISATTAGIDSTRLITVVGPVIIADNDTRLGYALADQPGVAGPYSPSDTNQFNSSGGSITITRDSAGWYNVRFLGLARATGPSGGRDNVQVTAFGSPAGVFCKLRGWTNDGADRLVPVHCHRADGTATDSRFTILLAGARAFDLTTPLGFVVLPPQPAPSAALDTSQMAFNSVSGQIDFGRGGVGSYSIAFPGISQPTGPVTILTSTLSIGTEHCQTVAYDLNKGGLAAACANTEGLAADARPDILWLSRGRAGHRYGYATTHSISAQIPPVDPLFTLNSSGGAVTMRRLAVGQWTATFAGLGRPAGGREVVLVSTFTGLDHLCTIVSWATAGSDLTATVQCFTAAGSPVDGQFSVAIIE